MLEIVQLRKQIHALEDGNDAAKKQALQALREPKEEEWADVTDADVHALIVALKDQLVSAVKQPLVQKDVATILGNLGARAKSALPQLIDLLQEGIPDNVREAAAIAIGRLGKDAKSAVDPLVQLIPKARPALSAQSIRALGNLGCADERVRSLLVNLWLSPLQHQNGK